MFEDYTAQGVGIPSGVVAFKDGGTTLGSGTIAANGVATFNTSVLLTGIHSISAIYGGSTNYNSSISNTINVVVTAIPTSVGLDASPNPASVGQNVTLVATTVSSLPDQIPTGTVTFSELSGILGTAPLIAGVARFSTTSLSAGNHTITATLNPTGSYASSSSNSITEIITDYNFVITTSSTSLTIPSSDYEYITVTVTPSGGFPRPVGLQCSSLPEHAQCSFSPSTTKPLSGGAQTVKLLVDTSDVLGYGHEVSRFTRAGPQSNKPSIFFATLLFPLCLWGLRRNRRHYMRNARRLFLLLALAGALMNLAACSGKLPGATSPGTYTFSITATDTQPGTSLAHTLNVNLEVTANK